MPSKKEEYFSPRTINPVKISQVLILAADEELQAAQKQLQENMPWVTVSLLTNPTAPIACERKEACVLICDDMALNLLDTKAVRRRHPDMVIVLVSSLELIHCSPPQVSTEKYPYTDKADMIFAANRKDCAPAKIITAIVRSAEDRLNIEKYSRARRYIFLVVDDEPRWISQFLPVLYDIIGQRAAVRFTRTYEETLEVLFGVRKESGIDAEHFREKGRGNDVVCLITDIFFPRGENLHSDAGKDLIHLIDSYYDHFPKIIASKAHEVEDLKGTAFVLPKGDPGSLETLRDYIHDFTGMGDFLVYSPSGNLLHRVKNIRDMLQVMKKAEKDTKNGQILRESLEKHGERDNFSTWLYMHGFKDLANKLLPMQRRGHPLVKTLKHNFEKEIKRIDSMPLIIAGHEIYTLKELLDALRVIPPKKIQKYSDKDVFSTWLDRKGYPELADELRPIHGSGWKLEKTLIEKVEKWIGIYESRIR